MLETVPTSAPAAPASDARRLHDEYVFPCVKPYYSEPLVLTEASGVRVRDDRGREYLDLFAGILTTSVGHCHPEVVDRVTEQLRRLGHTSTLYLTEGEGAVAERLARIAPGRLKRTFFTNSGSEAIETAIMIASMYTGRSEIVALRHAYSGRTIMTSNITAHSTWRPLESQVAGIKHAKGPYPYRCPFHDPCDGSCVDRFARELIEVIETTTSGRPAAFIAEPIQGVGGYVVLPPAYVRRAAEIIRSYGGLYISDEVQTGFGRSGGRWFGIEHSGVEPDIMVMAKGIANGAPVGATMTTDEIAAAWSSKTISTFGGNPISMAAAEATLDVLAREDAPARASARGAQLRAGLEALQSRYPWIGDVRGMGLMQALELVDDPVAKTHSPAKAASLLEAAKDEGVLIGLGGRYGNVIRMGPSLLITEDEIAEGLEKLGRACARVA
ncbi:MAG TPA: aspartate aminotransferase family protein [Longimicrobiales bacterium]|nr:aspartate aminotransferase family protein [Longimicrobiales bacterium]